MGGRPELPAGGQRHSVPRILFVQQRAELSRHRARHLEACSRPLDQRIAEDDTTAKNCGDDAIFRWVVYPPEPAEYQAFPIEHPVDQARLLCAQWSPQQSLHIVTVTFRGCGAGCPKDALQLPNMRCARSFGCRDADGSPFRRLLQHMRRLSDQPDTVWLSISGDEHGREPGIARAAAR